MSKQTLYLVIAAFIGASVISLIMTPFVRRFAFYFGAVDIPKDNRRMHTHPIPRLGGLAIFIGFMSISLALVDLDRQLLYAFIGASMIVLLGILDDKYALSAKPKFVVQILSAALPVIAGLRINFVNPFDFGSYYLFPEWLAFIVTILWIVGVTNAINFIDGLDGLACGVSSIACITLLVISIVTKQSDAGIMFMLSALTGACCGFLPYNIHPAKIFMGDTGATFLGYMLAVLSVSGMFKTSVAVSFLIPLIALGLPIFDTAFAIIRRILAGKSPMSADRGHLHHRLIDLGLTQGKAVGIIYILSAACGSIAIALVMTQGNAVWWIILTTIVFVVAAFRYFLHLVHEKERRNGTRH